MVGKCERVSEWIEVLVSFSQFFLPVEFNRYSNSSGNMLNLNIVIINHNNNYYYVHFVIIVKTIFTHSY